MKQENDLEFKFGKEIEGYGNEGKLDNYLADREISVTITLNEYRNLVITKATYDDRIKKSEDECRDYRLKNQELEADISKLKAENFDLKKEVETLQKRLVALETKTEETTA